MEHGEHDMSGMAASATLHCLTGCSVGEIVGMLVGTGAGLSNAATVPLSFGLAFVFGYTLSTLPLLRSGLAVGAAVTTVLAADTLSILTMEVVDNLVMVLVPGAMDAGLGNPVFWLSMSLALAVAYAAAYPVNKALLRRGKGHALSHGAMSGDARPEGWRRRVPDLPTPLLVTAIVAFVLGGLVVAVSG